MNRNRPANDRAAQNAQTLKALVKIEGNKVCADCKRNKHPRWASWNLGVFVCIRCSGIHRGMGTHISRVKSVDLDAWTDEQLQNVLKWGNTRANKYWESKLQSGHVPSEAKIENFIRTKYESRRWVMDGPMPDPATLGDDDDVPLNVVQEKAKIERSASQRQAQAQAAGHARVGSQSAVRAPPPPPQNNVNLFDDDFEPPARPSTTDAPQTRPAQPPPPQAAPRPAAKPADSLMGLDFFGNAPPAGVGRPNSAAANPAAATNTRGDLKNSILSLYASAPRPQAAPQPTHQRQPSFGGMGSPPAQKQDAFGGLTDAFGGLNFSSNTSSNVRSPPAQATPSAFDFTSTATPKSPVQQSSQSSAFAGLNFPGTVPMKATPAAAQVSSPPPLSGGDFFSPTATKPPAPKPAQAPASNGLNFSFTSRSPPAPAAPKPASNADFFGDDGFSDFASASPATAAPPVATKPQSPLQSPNKFNSVFNLSSPTTTAAKPAPVSRPAMPSQASNSLYNDPWGAADTNAWGAPETTPAKPAAPKVELGSVPSRITPNDISGGWGAPISSAGKTATQPSVTADEDFGGWTSASATQTPAAGKPSGSFGGSDPFDNPWG